MMGEVKEREIEVEHWNSFSCTDKSQCGWILAPEGDDEGSPFIGHLQHKLLWTAPLLARQ